MEERIILMFVMVMALILNETIGISMSKVMNVSSIGFQENLAHNVVCKEVEEKALIEFYSEIFYKKEDLETFLHNKGIKNCCNWFYVGFYVTCDAHGSIVSIEISNNNYTKVAHPSSWPIPLGKLQSLQALRIVGFDFDGRPLPPAVGLLPQSLLKLDIRDCNLQDPVPWTALANLSALTHLDLSYNLLRNSFHQVCNLTSLTDLDLYFNNLEGHFPACVSLLPHLSFLELSHNSLSGYTPLFSYNPISGQIPPSWNSSSSQLSFLGLGSNHLVGPFHNILALFFVHNLQSLLLTGNNLTGSIPESLPNLMPKLSVLDLSNNQISGTISQIQWEKLPQLFELELSGNRISGTISHIQWDKLLHLRWLDLSHNQLSGTLPASLGQLFTTASLQHLGLSHNNLAGYLEWWTQYCKANSIFDYRTLDLSHNLLSGSIPPFFNCGLAYLELSSNLLSGQIPTGFCSENPELVILRLADNNLNGSIPLHELSHCPRLSSLVLHNNHLTEFSTPAGISNLSSSLQLLDLSHNHLEGSIPVWLQQMYALRVLRLDYNNLSGPLPLSLWNTSQLQMLGFSHNNLRGVISAESLFLLQGFVYNSSRPVENHTTILYEESSIHAKGQDMSFAYLLKATVSLDLSYNDLQGPIPTQLGSLTGLVFLDLSHNNLNGSIPQNLSSLTQLQSLDLSSNGLEGKIPSDLCGLTFLAFANLSDNQLKGRIPGCQQWCTFNSSSFLGNRDLWVPPTGEQCASQAGRKNTTAAPTLEEQPAANEHEGMNEFLLAVVVGVCIAFPSTVILTIFWMPLSRPVRIMSRKLRATLCR